MRFFVNFQLIGASLLSGAGRLLSSFRAVSFNYKADLESLSFFEDNASAIAGGLEPGDLYVKSQDPCILCVVVNPTVAELLPSGIGATGATGPQGPQGPVGGTGATGLASPSPSPSPTSPI